MTMAITLIAFAAMALLSIVAGEAADLPFQQRLADAGRSRLPVAPARGRLRR
jgi:hypothetical protein